MKNRTRIRILQAQRDAQLLFFLLFTKTSRQEACWEDGLASYRSETGRVAAWRGSTYTLLQDSYPTFVSGYVVVIEWLIYRSLYAISILMCHS